MTPATTVPIVAPQQTVPRLRPVPGQTQASGRFTPGRRVPLTMPAAQEYFWRSAWQNGERAALEDLAAGRRVRFDSADPEDVARWLDEPDESDAG